MMPAGHTVLLLFCLAGITFSQQDLPSCDAGWEAVDPSRLDIGCLKFGREQGAMFWDAAKTYCQNQRPDAFLAEVWFDPIQRFVEQKAGSGERIVLLLLV